MSLSRSLSHSLSHSRSRSGLVEPDFDVSVFPCFQIDEKAGRISVVVGFKNPPFQESAVRVFLNAALKIIFNN